jgi:hypothetical protein
MKPEVKKIGSDLVDVEAYLPDDPDCFLLDINLWIGPDDGPGSEYFGCRICTPGWLAKHYGGPVVLRHTMIVDRYDFRAIRETIEGVVRGSACATWSETATKLSRYFSWEFEDYVP